jgi:hypothetical protein
MQIPSSVLVPYYYFSQQDIMVGHKMAFKGLSERWVSCFTLVYGENTRKHSASNQGSKSKSAPVC